MILHGGKTGLSQSGLVKINVLNWLCMWSGRQQASCEHHAALLAPVAMVKRLRFSPLSGVALDSARCVFAHCSASACRRKSVSAPRPAERARVLEYDSRLAWPKISPALSAVLVPCFSGAIWQRESLEQVQSERG